MKTSAVDFPKPPLDALRDGRLVVFAGAGVSTGVPAGLPNFGTLAEDIAQGTGEVLGDREQEDGFLGRLQDKGVEVHTRAAQRLVEGNPQPTDLHKNLLRLYPTPSAVRLVTTTTLQRQLNRTAIGTLPLLCKD